MKYLLLLLLLITACGSHKDSATATTSSTTALGDRYEAYLSFDQPHLDRFGWTIPQLCDGLLFTSLQAVGEGKAVELDAARDSNGVWHRSPDVHCDDDNSRDAFLGIMLYSLAFNRLDYLEQIWQYGEDHSWKMGNSTDSRDVLLPQDIGLLARSIAHLGGTKHAETAFPLPLLDLPGYRNHLQELSILIDAESTGGVTSDELSFLRKLASEMPNNPLPHALLHRYSDGDQSTATELLLSRWPADRLPDYRDWCSEWIVQETMDGITPCSDKSIRNTGGDFMFVASLILGSVR